MYNYMLREADLAEMDSSHWNGLELVTPHC